MCGYILSNIKNKKKFLSLKKYVIHRGPDNQNYYKINQWHLYHSRLKIIDIKSRSNQPFTDKEKKYFLLFNGEIYNFKQLQNKYKIQIKTTSDTEILFILLKNLGLNKTLKEIKGMFSFTFLDLKKNIIYCARDHFGQKPLYYSNDKIFSCSTNIKPLTKFIKKLEFDQECVEFYLNSSGILPINKTIYKNILALPAGNYLKYNINTKKLIVREYFHPTDLISKNYNLFLSKQNDSYLENNLKIKIYNAVKDCLISDAKVGTLLSGGIDSSIITFFAKKIDPKITTFTGVSQGIEKIPKKIVPKIIKKIKLKNPKFIKHYSHEYINRLNELITKSYSPSRWGGGIPMSKICKIAKKNNLKVLLSGDAVDEICGGYNTFSQTKLELKNTYHQILEVNTNNKLAKKYKNFLKKNRQKIKECFSHLKSKKEMNKQILFIEDINIFLQTCTLPHGDEYSMHESIELRNPYLDLDLVSFLINLPSKYKSKINEINDNGKKLFKVIAKQLYGKKINKEKEGTRNYSKKISDKIFWKLDEFKILKKYKIKLDELNYYKLLFKIVNLEILYRESILNDKKFNIKSILSKDGLIFFKKK